MKQQAVALTAEEIAEKLGGAPVFGQRQVVLTNIAPLETACASDLSFVSEDRKRRAQLLSLAASSGAGALLVAQYLPDALHGKTQIVTRDPLAALVKLAPLFAKTPRAQAGVHETASVAKSAILGANVSIGAFCAIGEDVQIGASTVLHPHVVIYPGAKIGALCVIHAGAVIREFVELGDDCLVQNGVVVGGDGFGYFTQKGIAHHRIPHLGNVHIGAGVDIGANATIDRATLGATFIDDGTKIDNLVMIGHNVRIGKRSLLCGQVGVSGSARIGTDVTLAGQVGVADHAVVGNGARAAAKTGVYGVVPEKTDVAGFMWSEANLWRRCHSLVKRLPELARRLSNLEKRLDSTTNTQT